MSPKTLQIPCACAAVRQASRLITQLYEEEMPGQLAVPQFGLLSVIEKLPGCSQATLSRALDLDKTTLSRNLRLMQKNGWIQLRLRGYHLTETGSKLLRAAKPGWKRAQDRLRSALGDRQWETMWEIFGNITDAARQSLGKQPPGGAGELAP